ELLGFGPNFLGREIEVGLVDVADGHYLAILVLQESVQHLIAPVAQADEPQADAVAGPEDAGRAEGGADSREGGRLGKRAARHLAHGDFLFCRRRKDATIHSEASAAVKLARQVLRRTAPPSRPT